MNPYIDIMPLVVPIGRSIEFTITTHSDMRQIRSGSNVSLSVNSVRDFRAHADIQLSVSPEGTIAFEFEARIPGEHIVSVYRDASRWPTETGARVSFYAVPPELGRLYPYRGDLHMHSSYSDGTSSVPTMLSRSREVGLDFVAITDHRVFSASVEAEEWANDAGVTMAVIRGEEVNFPLGIGHIVALNTDRPVSDRFDMHETDNPPDTNAARDQIAQMTDQLVGEYEEEISQLGLDETVDRELFGWCYRIARDIRQAGGLAVLAHPYWRSRGVLDLVASTYDAVLRHRIFDAVEVINGSGLEGVMLALAKAVDHGWLEGEVPPFIGSSDAHSVAGLGSRYTLAFAPELTVRAILDAIQACRTVACVEGGASEPLIVGSYDLVEYAYFLLREFFPLHDALCKAQGALHGIRIPDGFAAGADSEGNSEVVANAARDYQGRIAALYSRCFAW